jgi:hypothetical protein
MKRGFMKVTKSQAKQIRALKRMKDEDIDFSDIPELTGDENFVVGKFYRPGKKLVVVRKSTNKNLKTTNSLKFCATVGATP